MSGPGFAVLNFETTGPSYEGLDRVVELSVVHADAHGTITGGWDTLINPGRTLGRQSVHRIRASDVRNAPTFFDAAPQLVDLLSGRVLVAHGARITTGFLLAELDRIDYVAPPLTLGSLCTRALAREFLPRLASHTLARCCVAYGIPVNKPRCAATHAEATAGLLAAYIAAVPRAIIWADSLASAAAAHWDPIAHEARDWFARADVVAA